MGRKHGANNLEDYRRIFEKALYDLEQRGFVYETMLTFTPVPGAIEIRGKLECPGSIFVRVQKLLMICGGNEKDPLVRTVAYSYNTYVNGIGTRVRYDSPHPHRPYHHVHRYDLLNGDFDGHIQRIDDDAWPHLSEVVEEVVHWYWKHIEEVDALYSRRRAEDQR